MNTTSAGYMSAEYLYKITTKTRDDAPIGLFPQLFAVYKWLQQSKNWNCFGDEIVIPDKISWKNFREAWSIERLFTMNGWDNITLRLDFTAPKIGEFYMRINVAVIDRWFDEESSPELINYEFKYTEKNTLNLPSIEKHIEKCQQFCDEMEQVYNDRQRACDDILARYK